MLILYEGKIRSLRGFFLYKHFTDIFVKSLIDFLKSKTCTVMIVENMKD